MLFSDSSSFDSSREFSPSASISPECRIVENDQTVRVPLSLPAGDWFQFLQEQDDLLHFAHSSVAVLARFGPIPALNWARSSVVPTSVGGEFSPNLAEHASLWAVRESYPEGPVYLLEVRDVQGGVSQRFVIPAGPARVRYESLVARYQSRPGKHRPWCPPNSRENGRRLTSLRSRIPSLRQRFSAGSDQVRRLPLSRVAGLLARAVGAGQRLQTRVYNPSLILTATWTPEFHTPAWSSVAAGEPTVRFLGEGTGLELRHQTDGSAWLWTGACSCCGVEKWAVEVGTREDQLALSLTAADPLQEAEWREFLEPLRRETE